MSIPNIIFMLVLIGIAFFVLIYLLPEILSKHLKKNLQDSNIIITTILISFIFLVATYLVALFFKKTDFIEKIGSADAWIGFAGSIMGGFITMLALFFTLKDNQDARKQDHIISLKPYLACNITKTVENEWNSNMNDPNNISTIHCNMCNVSNNLANDIKLIKEYTETAKEKELTSEDLLNKFGIVIKSMIDDNSMFLAPNQEYSFRTSLKVYKDKADYLKRVPFIFKHKIVFQYSDASDLQKYTLEFKYDIEIQIDEYDIVRCTTENPNNKIDLA